MPRGPLLTQADAHRDPQPEELRRLDALGRDARLVDEQVAVVQRLHAEELEIEVGRRIDRSAKARDVVLQHRSSIRPHATPRSRSPRNASTCALRRPSDAVPLDRPVEHLLVHEREQHARREAAEVGVAIDQRAGVQDDEAREVVAADAVVDPSSQLGLDADRLVEREVEPGAGETDPLAQLVAAPRRLASVALEQGDGPCGRHGGGRPGAQQRPLGAVDDVALGEAHAAREDELLLHEVLYLLDRDVRRAEAANALGDAGGDRGGGSRVEPCRDEPLAHGTLDLGLVLDATT